MTNETVAVDFRGNEIRVGDTVLYPRMSGRSVEMTEARVERIDVNPKGRRIQNPAHEEWLQAWRDATPEGIRHWDTPRPAGEPEMMISIPAWKFSLLPLRSTRFTRWWASRDRPVFIQLGENVVRVMDA